MPLVTWDSQADWDAAYLMNAPEGGLITYGRRYYELYREPSNNNLSEHEYRWGLITGLPTPPTTSDRILVAGSAFGFLIEVAKADGFTFTGGIDSSPWVVGKPDIAQDTVWLADDFTKGPQIRNALRTLQRDLGLPGNRRNGLWDWLITEAVVESYSDAELTAPLNQNGVLAACEAAMDHTDYFKIVHLLMPIPSAPEAQTRALNDAYWNRFNQKTLADWHALAPAHTWVNMMTGEVM